MKPEILFLICNNLVLPGWILLIFAPKWLWTKRIINSCIIPLLLGLVYLFLIVTNIGSSEGSFMSLEGVEKLFQNRNLLLAGWIHYLAFDLFVGSWELRDSQKSGISHWLVVPCLIFTFLLGPIGLVFYFFVKWWVTKEFIIEQESL